MRHEHIQASQSSTPFWESSLFVALASGLVVWGFGVLYNRAVLHRQRADLLLKVQRQLLRQFRDLMILREFYEPCRHLSSGVNQMKLMIHGFSEEKIMLSEISFALEYVQDAADFEILAEADSEYQCLVSGYRQWTESYLQLRSVGRVAVFDSKTGMAQKDLTQEDLISLRMHFDYSTALIQTLDRAVALNQKATASLVGMAFSHRKKFKYAGSSRTKVITNSAEMLSNEEASSLRLAGLHFSSPIEFPCAVFAARSIFGVAESAAVKPVAATLSFLGNDVKVLASAANLSFSDAVRVSRDLKLTHFYWLNGENVLLVDAWLYRPSEHIGSIKDIVRKG